MPMSRSADCLARATHSGSNSRTRLVLAVSTDVSVLLNTTLLASCQMAA